MKGVGSALGGHVLALALAFALAAGVLAATDSRAAAIATGAISGGALAGWAAWRRARRDQRALDAMPAEEAAAQRDRSRRAARVLIVLAGACGVAAAALNHALLSPGLLVLLALLAVVFVATLPGR